MKFQEYKSSVFLMITSSPKLESKIEIVSRVIGYSGDSAVQDLSSEAFLWPR